MPQLAEESRSTTMAYWLFKQEPSDYSFADLERDGTTTWDGVANALALRYLGRVQVGDEIMFYHTGQEKAVVGLMRAQAVSTDASGTPSVRVVADRRLPRPVTLAEIKADATFAEWELTRQPRLSIMPIAEKLWTRLLRMSERPHKKSGTNRSARTAALPRKPSSKKSK